MEIVVRKTLATDTGASSALRQAIRPAALIAFVIAAPIGWWLMNKYLADFQYYIDLNATIFLAAIGIMFLIAIVTIGYRSMKADPMKVLSSERLIE